MTLCALGMPILSFPALVSSQEACVMTSAGDIVCGKPVPKSTPGQNRTDNDETLQRSIESNVTWELKSCVRKRGNVSCTLVLTASDDRGDYVVVLNNGTKLVDSSGNEYYASQVQIGKRFAGSNSQLNFTMAKGAHYKVTIDFTDVPTSISQVNLLQIITYAYAQVKFRNVPIY